MKVRSIAPHLPDGEVVIVRDRETLMEYEVVKGKPADLPDALALSLLEQTDAWAPSGKEAAEAAEKAAS